MRRLLYVNSALVLVIGIPLSLLPARTGTFFAWTIHPPLTAAALGAGYWASFVLELLSAPTVLLGAWPWPLTPLTSRAIGAWAVGIGTIAAILLLGGYGWWKAGQAQQAPV